MSQSGGTADVTDEQLSILAESLDHDRRIADRLMFATDETLAGWLRPTEERLRVVENYVADQKARIPGIERECAAIRQNITKVREQLEPRSRTTDGLKPAA